jgi:hypothetical protein
LGEGVLGADVGVVVVGGVGKVVVVVAVAVVCVVVIVADIVVSAGVLVVADVFVVVVEKHAGDLFGEFDQQGGFPPTTAKEAAVPAAANRLRAAT